WTGYAVQVVNAAGDRRVQRGPAVLLLGWDETLDVLELSTGKPKSTDALLRTPYLQVEANKVADIVHVETKDHVLIQLKEAYLVAFEGDAARWFQVSNYVKLLCDHARSLLKGALQRYTVEEFYDKSTDVVRDIILGQAPEDGGGRPGLAFRQNGMRVVD